MNQVKTVCPSSEGKHWEVVNAELLFLYSPTFPLFFAYMKTNWLQKVIVFFKLNYSSEKILKCNYVSMGWTLHLLATICNLSTAEEKKKNNEKSSNPIMFTNAKITKGGPKSKVEEAPTINSILLLEKRYNDTLPYTGRVNLTPQKGIKSGYLCILLLILSLGESCNNCMHVLDVVLTSL